jgi:hypothetical protein
LAAAVGARASRSATTSAFRARRACVSRVDDPTARACRSGLGSHETKPSLGRSRADAAVSRAATGTDDGAGRVGVRRMLSSGRGVGKCARARLWSTVSPRGTHMRINIKICIPSEISTYLLFATGYPYVRNFFVFFFYQQSLFRGRTGCRCDSVARRRRCRLARIFPLSSSSGGPGDHRSPDVLRASRTPPLRALCRPSPRGSLPARVRSSERAVRS